MDRRKFLKYAASTTLFAGLGGSYYWLSKERNFPHLAIEVALEKLDKLDLGKIENIGEWEVARVFAHLQQGIDFSISGYPQEKHPAFQQTIGKLAFSVFQARGEMSHNLSDPIPGETIATAKSSPKQALNQLKSSLIAFQSHNGPLKPHFAYGDLNKSAYTNAHIMHINNHLLEFKVS